MDYRYKKLSEITKVKIKNKDLYLIALTHRSYLNEHSDYKYPSNERLEFLGDSVLQLLSSEYLYNKYPQQPEGILTNYRAAMVCTLSIGTEAKRLGYGELLLMSNGEESTGGRERIYILANTFEAVLGAMYLDSGIEACREFVNRELLYKIEKVVKNKSYKDPKSNFQELAQEKLNITPVYKVLNSWGLDHEKTFSVAVYLNKEEYGVGEGKSKHRAQQSAAIKGLDKLSAM